MHALVMNSCSHVATTGLRIKYPCTLMYPGLPYPFCLLFLLKARGGLGTKLQAIKHQLQETNPCNMYLSRRSQHNYTSAFGVQATVKYDPGQQGQLEKFKEELRKRADLITLKRKEHSERVSRDMLCKCHTSVHLLILITHK